MSIAHTELNTTDPKTAKKFYSGVFGWKFNDMSMPGGVYTMVTGADGKPFGGIQPSETKGSPSQWVNYITVANLKRTIAKAEKRGGKAVSPVIDVPGQGSYAVLQDPSGAHIGVWQAAPPPKAKKAAPKRAKKAAPKKTASKKATRKAAPKKATRKKAAPKKATRKAAPKKATRKKAAPKKATRKAAPKKATRKAAPKKATRKAAPKKATRKAAPKKATRKRA